MPDEELDELLQFESLLNGIFFLDLDLDVSHNYSDFDQVIARIKKEENESGYIV